MDVLQKMSDPVLVDCPACGAPKLHKQLTAAGFQLKGSGWYATDFKGGATASAAVPAEGEATTASGTAATPATSAESATAAVATASATPSAPAPAAGVAAT